jgi:hypothetical protein
MEGYYHKSGMILPSAHSGISEVEMDIKYQNILITLLL